ncbi:hypothetical protein Tco_1061817, partial [Tanacetum coccineum]
AIADNANNALFDDNTFINPFATPSTSSAESSSHYVDLSNMFYQSYQHDLQWTKDHPLSKVIGEPSKPVLTRNQRTYAKMCIYALSLSTMEPRNVIEALIDAGWIEAMQDNLLQFNVLRPDIVHATCLCAQYQVNPTEKHLKEMLIMQDVKTPLRVLQAEHNS